MKAATLTPTPHTCQSKLPHPHYLPSPATLNLSETLTNMVKVFRL